MATWTAATAVATGGLITSAWMNTTVGAINFLGAASSSTGKDLFFARQGSAQAIGLGAIPYPLTFGGEDIDVAGGHSTTTNTSRYTATAAGKYRVFGAVAIPSSYGTRSVTVGFLKNGSTVGINNTRYGQSANQLIYAPTQYISLNANDYIELYTYGSGLDSFTTIVGTTASHFGVEWVGA